MADYATPIDIANRALQHCGAKRIVTFLDDSKNAAEAGFTYDKVRSSELRREVWRFATRRAILRPIGANTQRLVPTATAAGTATATVGKLIQVGRHVFIGKAAGSSDPFSSTAHWEGYFGPLTAEAHVPGTSYYAGDVVTVGGSIFRSLASGNLSTPGASSTWQVIDTGLLSMATQQYPLGAGPSTHSVTRNVYLLPAGFMREAPEDPKSGYVDDFSRPAGLLYKDWQIENEFIITGETLPIIFRFVADVTDVTKFDPMFCEGLAARMALEMVEIITQSAEKTQVIGASYNRFMGEARDVNAVEVQYDARPTAAWAGENPGWSQPLDIANRALQLCGASRIQAMTEDSDEAAEVAFAYEKMRVAELRRNVWRFSIRNTVIRPIEDTTLLFAPPAYAEATAYTAGHVVTYNGGMWEANGSATGDIPGQPGTIWQQYFGARTVAVFDADIVWQLGELVASAGVTYRSLKPDNSAAVADTASWKSLGAATAALSILYPIGAGSGPRPAWKRVYMLPAGFLRMAPQDPKQGSHSPLGAPGGGDYEDWDLQDRFIVTRDFGPLNLRFAADVSNVSEMDPMFCEGLAARIAMSCADALARAMTLKQASVPVVVGEGQQARPISVRSNLNAVTGMYRMVMAEARTVNGIETGPTEAPEDDWVTCRR